MTDGCPETVCAETGKILEMLGEIFAAVHQEDISLQAAICVLVSNNESALQHSKDLQHVDLITQFHANMARVFHVLSKQMQTGKIVREELLEVLTLQSLKDCFEAKASGRGSQDTGDMTLL